MLCRRAYMSRSRLVERSPEEGSRKWLIWELDRLTSIIVRKRDKRCVTCGSVQSLQCSHFYSRECFDADSGKDLAVEVREYYIPDFSNWKNHDDFEREFKRLYESLKAEA